MQIKLPATALSIKEESFTDKENKIVSYYHAILLVDGEIVEVNTKDVNVIDFITENLNQEKTYILDFIKNRYGAYKIRISL